MNNKQEVFLDAYLETWNSSEAARRAGYKGDPNTIGPRLLADVGIKARVAERLAEKAMQADEVLARLAEQARVTIADFVIEDFIPITNKDGDIIGKQKTVGLNWDAIRSKGHLIKSVKPTTAGIAIELHDAQVALIQIGKGNGALKAADNPVTVNVTITPEQMAEARARAQAFDDEQEPAA